MRRHILVDLDDTVSASWRREHLIQDSWDAFHADLVNDEPIYDVVRLLSNLAFRPAWSDTNTIFNTIFNTSLNTLDTGEGLRLVALTARPEKWRAATMNWLHTHCVPIDELLMRPDNDFRPSPVCKVAVAAERFGGEEAIKDHVALIIDDHEGVCKAFAGLGVTTLQIYARRT
jgi:hypothetical protein